MEIIAQLITSAATTSSISMPNAPSGMKKFSSTHSAVAAADTASEATGTPRRFTRVSALGALPCSARP